MMCILNLSSSYRNFSNVPLQVKLKGERIELDVWFFLLRDMFSKICKKGASHRPCQFIFTSTRDLQAKLNEVNYFPNPIVVFGVRSQVIGIGTKFGLENHLDQELEFQILSRSNHFAPHSEWYWSYFLVEYPMATW